MRAELAVAGKDVNHLIGHFERFGNCHGVDCLCALAELDVGVVESDGAVAVDLGESAGALLILGADELVAEGDALAETPRALGGAALLKMDALNGLLQAVLGGVVENFLVVAVAVAVAQDVLQTNLVAAYA